MPANIQRLTACVLLSASACVLATGCQSSAKAKDAQATLGAINDHCPVLTFKNVDSDAPTATYKGHVVGFCCDSCPKKWESWSDEKKDAYIAKQMKSQP